MNNCNNSEQGNVLFLILIAVTLFAALSYAVTSSNRSGGDSSSETSLISSSALTQTPAQVRSAISRMFFQKISLSEMEFNKPEDLGTCTRPEVCVFHPQGGGATFASVSPKVITTGFPNNGWRFTYVWEIVDVGSSVAASFDGNDIMMYIMGVKQGVCDKVNEKMGIAAGIPSIGFNNAIMTLIENNFNLDNGWAQSAVNAIIGTGVTVNLVGHPEGCFQTTDGINVFYSILLER